MLFSTTSARSRRRELSGYVFIDEPTIVFAEDDPPTPEEIAAIRDGTRTPDDTPLQA